MSSNQKELCDKGLGVGPDHQQHHSMDKNSPCCATGWGRVGRAGQARVWRAAVRWAGRVRVGRAGRAGARLAGAGRAGCASDGPGARRVGRFCYVTPTLHSVVHLASWSLDPGPRLHPEPTRSQITEHREIENDTVFSAPAWGLQPPHGVCYPRMGYNVATKAAHSAQYSVRKSEKSSHPRK